MNDLLPLLGGFLYHHWTDGVPFLFLIDFSLPSLDGFALPLLFGLSLPSLSGSLPSLDGSVPVAFIGWLCKFFFTIFGWICVASLDGLSLPSLGGSLPSLDGLLSPSLDDFFLVFTIFFEGGEAVPAGVVSSTLTPDLHSGFFRFWFRAVPYLVFTGFAPEAHSPRVAAFFLHVSGVPTPTTPGYKGFLLKF